MWVDGCGYATVWVCGGGWMGVDRPLCGREGAGWVWVCHCVDVVEWCGCTTMVGGGWIGGGCHCVGVGVDDSRG